MVQKSSRPPVTVSCMHETLSKTGYSTKPLTHCWQDLFASTTARSIELENTPRKFRIAVGKGHSQKESSLPTIILQSYCIYLEGFYQQQTETIDGLWMKDSHLRRVGAVCNAGSKLPPESRGIGLRVELT